MSPDEFLTAVADNERQRLTLRALTRDRVHVDPVAYAVAHLLRRLCELPAAEQADGILDATAAILAFTARETYDSPAPRRRMTADELMVQARRLEGDSQT